MEKLSKYKNYGSIDSTRANLFENKSENYGDEMEFNSRDKNNFLSDNLNFSIDS